MPVIVCDNSSILIGIIFTSSGIGILIFNTENFISSSKYDTKNLVYISPSHRSESESAESGIIRQTFLK